MRCRTLFLTVALAVFAASPALPQSQAASPPQQQNPAPKSNSAASLDLLNQVNSCDRACADQIARAVNSHSSAQQKQSQPNVVEKSKQDSSWQALLEAAIAVQSQSCESQSGKVQNANMAKGGEKEAANRLADISARANAHIKTIADPYVAEFMRLQINRVWNAPCPNFVAHIPSRRDPEDIDAQKNESATSDPPDDNR